MLIILKHACLIQILLIGLFLPASSVHASSSDSPEQGESMQPEVAEDECSCSIRKRKQVERRLEKKKQAEQE